VGTRYIFLTPNAGNLPLLDTDGRLPPGLLPDLADTQVKGLYMGWNSHNVDPGAAEVQVFSAPIPERCRIIRGLVLLTGIVGAGQAATLSARIYVINGQGQVVFPVSPPASRGAAGQFTDTTAPVSYDFNPDMVGAGWTLRFNVVRDNPVNMLEYQFNGIAIFDPA